MSSSGQACHRADNLRPTVDEAYVTGKLEKIVADQDLARYIL
jgi:ATP-dependent protease HslVU (ClpYQ) ATPase subunit